MRLSLNDAAFEAFERVIERMQEVPSHAYSRVQRAVEPLAFGALASAGWGTGVPHAEADHDERA
jgi:hypothetical protein